jgi:hypothetical protein
MRLKVGRGYSSILLNQRRCYKQGLSVFVCMSLSVYVCMSLSVYVCMSLSKSIY